MLSGERSFLQTIYSDQIKGPLPKRSASPQRDQPLRNLWPQAYDAWSQLFVCVTSTWACANTNLVKPAMHAMPEEFQLATWGTCIHIQQLPFVTINEVPCRI